MRHDFSSEAHQSIKVFLKETLEGDAIDGFMALVSLAMMIILGVGPFRGKLMSTIYFGLTMIMLVECVLGFLLTEKYSDNLHIYGSDLVCSIIMLVVIPHLSFEMHFFVKLLILVKVIRIIHALRKMESYKLIFNGLIRSFPFCVDLLCFLLILMFIYNAIGKQSLLS